MELRRPDNAYVNKFLQSQCHIIATIRTKQDYVLSEKNGKMVPEKVGLKDPLLRAHGVYH